MLEDAVRTGSSVHEAGYLNTVHLALGKWYRSKDKKGGRHPFASYMMNKKWTMEEEFNNHILRFQQVTIVSSNDFINYISLFQAGLLVIEVHFEVKCQPSSSWLRS